MKKVIEMQKNRNVGFKSGFLQLNWGLIIAAGCLVLSPQFVSAQIVSNLAQGANGAGSITSTQWGASKFTTGANVGGYTLESVTGKFAAQTTAGTFVAQIFSDSSSRPNVSLETLTGASPETAGNHTFSSAGLSLDANTSYWLAWTATSGHFGPEFTFSNDESSTDGWLMGGRSSSGDSGGNWSGEGGLGANLFSVQATPVPEPHEYAAIVGFGLVGFVVIRRRFQLAASV